MLFGLVAHLEAHHDQAFDDFAVVIFKLFQETLYGSDNIRTSFPTYSPLSVITRHLKCFRRATRKSITI